MGVFCCQSQKKIIDTEEGVYYKDIRLNDYLGTWEYYSDDELFRIVLVPRKVEGPGNMKMDLIYGYYFYVKNGETIINTLPELATEEFKVEKTSMVGGIILDSNILELSLKENFNNKNLLAKLKFLNNDKSQIQWSVEESDREFIKVLSADSLESFIKTKEQDFSMPRRLILSKTSP